MHYYFSTLCFFLILFQATKFIYSLERTSLGTLRKAGGQYKSYSNLNKILFVKRKKTGTNTNTRWKSWNLGELERT